MEKDIRYGVLHRILGQLCLTEFLYNKDDGHEFYSVTYLDDSENFGDIDNFKICLVEVEDDKIIRLLSRTMQGNIGVTEMCSANKGKLFHDIIRNMLNDYLFKS